MTPHEVFHTSLPELDKLNREQLAKLVGIAVINRDSGCKSGKGQESKVAIVACKRKLLSILTTMVSNDSLWKDVKQSGAA